MKILVTGGNGLLGRAIIKSFPGDQVLAPDSDSLDISRPDSIAIIEQSNPDVIIHAAAMTDVDACENTPEAAFQINESGTKNIVAGANCTNARIVYISTDYVFDGHKNTPYLESDFTEPINQYGRSKLAGEQAVISDAGEWLIVRTSWLFGYGRSNFVTQVLEWSKDKPVLNLVDDKTGSPTFTNDLALSLVFLVQNNRQGQIVHVSGRGSCSWYDYGKKILELSGISKKITPISFAELKRPAPRPSYSVLSNTTLLRMGFSMPTWQESLEIFLK